MKKRLLIVLSLLLIISIPLSYIFAQEKEKPQKKEEGRVKQVLPKDDTKDYIRCDEETYKKYSELRPKYLDIQRKIGEIDAKLKMNNRNLEKLKGMSDDEIDKDVREENIKIIEEESSRLKLDRKRLEEEGIQFYKTYEPIRHKCED